MSKLDEIKPTANDGLYKIEIQVEGQWILMAGMTKESIIKLSDYGEMLSDKDNEARASGTT